MISRELQNKLLNYYAEIYPQITMHAPEIEGYDYDIVGANLYYLYGHGLIEGERYGRSSSRPILNHIRITSKGLDFLEDDGGLAAILGTITVKIHKDSILELLLERAKVAEGDETARAKLIDAIKALPAEGLKAVAQRIMEAGMDRVPATLKSLAALVSNPF